MKTKDSEIELFSNNMKFTGKHADYLRKLAPSKKIGEHIMQRPSIFASNIEVLTAAPIIGFMYKRKGKIDKNQNITDNNIFQEQLIKIKKVMLRNYRIILLLDDKENVSAQDRMDRAFKYDRDIERRQDGYNLFMSYLLGGIEVLYEQLLDGSTSTKEDYMNCCNFVEKYRKMVLKSSNEYVDSSEQKYKNKEKRHLVSLELKEHILNLCNDASL